MSLPAVTERTLERLALIRELYLSAVRTAAQPEPVGGLSVLPFHDTVEMFLHLAATHLEAPLPKGVKFMEYWGHIAAKLPEGVELSGQVAMEQLNNARVGLKHHGNLPSRLTSEGHRAAVTSFFDANTPVVFGQSFNDLDMMSLVIFPKTRECLERAKELQSQSAEVPAALEQLALAFHHSLREYREAAGAPPFWGWSPSAYSPMFQDGSDFASEVESAIGDLATELDGQVERLEEAIEMVAMGMDLRRWQRFELWTPWVSRRSEELDFRWQHDPARHDDEHVEYCRRFVIDSALQLQALLREP